MPTPGLDVYGATVAPMKDRTQGGSSIAVLPVRDGVLPAGSFDAVRAAHGEVLVIGAQARDAAAQLAGSTRSVKVLEASTFAPGAWAELLAPTVADVEIVVLPTSPDGRDLAPRLAALLGRPVLAGAVSIGDAVVSTACLGGAVLADHVVGEPVVVTFQPGVGHHGAGGDDLPSPEPEEVDAGDRPPGVADATVVEVLAPDVATMDLAEAGRIVGGGAGLDSAERFDELTGLATAIGASMGATRVVTDRAWVPHSRQIGTTGVVVAPALYLAFGISGAVQHTAGLGDPDHVISVNTDPHCPMMAMADLAVVADANATLDELRARLGVGADPHPATEHADA